MVSDAGKICCFDPLWIQRRVMLASCMQRWRDSDDSRMLIQDSECDEAGKIISNYTISFGRITIVNMLFSEHIYGPLVGYPSLRIGEDNVE